MNSEKKAKIKEIMETLEKLNGYSLALVKAMAEVLNASEISHKEGG